MGVVILGPENLAHLQIAESRATGANGNGNGNGNGKGAAAENDSPHADSFAGAIEPNGENGSSKRSLVQIQPPSDLPVGESLQPMYCDQPWSVIYMAWNGDIRTCCFNDYSLGNVDHNTIDEIWNGPKYHSMRKSIARGQVLDVCRDCLNGHANYSVVPKLEPTLLLTEIRSMFHRAFLA